MAAVKRILNMRWAMNALTVQIIASAVGSSPVMPFATLNEASEAYRAFLNENDLGSRDAGRCIIRQGGKVVAHISYNGKVWPGERWVAESVPIFDPGMEATCAS
jgi:hypothetical protein